MVLGRLNNQVERLTFLVTNLLDISKIEAGKLEFNYTTFDYDEMVEETIRALTNDNQHSHYNDYFKD
jgi:K+-sensing histidine kinase KdpD